MKNTRANKSLKFATCRTDYVHSANVVLSTWKDVREPIDAIFQASLDSKPYQKNKIYLFFLQTYIYVGSGRTGNVSRPHRLYGLDICIWY